MEIIYRPIGIIHTPFKEPGGTPIQPDAAKGTIGTIEIFPEYQKGLKDLEEFSHIFLLYHFHLSKPYSLEVIPFMDNRCHGLFATRASSRPNPIGLSVVKLIKIKANILIVKDVDIVDGTPLLDIKPCVPEFDQPVVKKKGWLEKNVKKLKKSRDDERFVK